MLHPDTELRFVKAAIGYGVFATHFIPKGTITWVLDDLDQVITPAMTERLKPGLQGQLEKYSYLNGRGERILCWDHSRFLNHSCQPTCLAPGFDFEIAIRDIREGEELTDDYGALNVEAFNCECGTKECRGTIDSDDFIRYSDRWDKLIADAFPLISRVSQPLWDLVAEKEIIKKVLAGEAPLPSCRAHFLGAESDRRQETL